ncbi:hypothetical protein AAVH_36543 [Aphelenchoides avenae]|nr:hypothetical protein AAVH_36543 [Aphelenchus avenae]
MKVLDRKRVVDFWKDVVVGLFPWAIFCVCFNMIPFVRGYLSAMAVWSFFLALLCTRIVNFCLPQQAATDDPKNTLLPPTTWAEMITEALDGTLETARLLRCDSSRGAAKLCKKKVAEKLIGGADPEQLFKELDEQILNGLRRLSEDANQRLEGLKNKFGLDATKLSKTGLAKLSDADCRAALPIALEAAGWLMQCHKANEEVRRLENPLNVKARQCATQLDELNEKFTKAVAELIAVSYNEDECEFY